MDPIKTLIKNGQLEAALAALETILPSHLVNNIVLLRSQLSDLENGEMEGIKTGKGIQQEKNKIAKSALKLYDRSKSSYSPNPNVESIPDSNKEKSQNVTAKISLELTISLQSDSNSRGLLTNKQTNRTSQISNSKLSEDKTQDQLKRLVSESSISLSELLCAIAGKSLVVQFADPSITEG